MHHRPLNFVLVASLLTLFIFHAKAMTTVQTSTSIGLYRDYQQTNHYPLYHSWSLHGFYDNGTETSLNFILNNDFAVNKWSFFPTQAEFDIPLSARPISAPERQSRIKLGRQLYTEGFDFALLDGAQVPLYWSTTGGVMPIGGVIRSPEVDTPSESYAPLLGLVAWEQFYKVRIRTGYTARDENLTNRYVFAALARQFESLPFNPELYVKEELTADNMAYHQFTSDLALIFTDSVMGRIGYSNLQPRPIQKKELASFVYQLLAVSPTESVNLDLTWETSATSRLNCGGARAFYNSGFRNETSDRQDISADFELLHGHWLAPSITHLTSFGGEVSDGGLKYYYNASGDSRYQIEYDLAYISKINQIQGWVQHIRTGYETRVGSRMKALFNVEAERNQYYEFDVRTMAYVTNYL